MQNEPNNKYNIASSQYTIPIKKTPSKSPNIAYQELENVDLATGSEEDASKAGGEDEEDEERDHGRRQHLLHLGHHLDFCDYSDDSHLLHLDQD